MLFILDPGKKRLVDYTRTNDECCAIVRESLLNIGIKNISFII